MSMFDVIHHQSQQTITEVRKRLIYHNNKEPWIERMCGRASQTQTAVRAAEAVLKRSCSSSGAQADAITDGKSRETSNQVDERDNFNMSPGMDAVVFWQNRNDGTLRVDRKVWGLVPKGGTPKSPLDTGMSQHFSNLMFNARADTLLEKRTFRPLLLQGQTCLLAVDGFFEWKAPALKGSKKQPYFVYRRFPGKDEPSSEEQSSRSYLLLAGLWTCVPTGRPDQPTLETFTILTTDACPSLTWLHTRMPVCVWDESLARAWLERPTPALVRQIDQEARNSPPDILAWHAVTTQMSSMKYRSKDSMKALPPPKTVKSFFAAAAKKGDESTTTSTASATKTSPPGRVKEKEVANTKETSSPAAIGKGSAASTVQPSTPSREDSKKREPATSFIGSSGTRKRAKTPVKKGSITSFFSPKTK